MVLGHHIILLVGKDVDLEVENVIIVNVNTKNGNGPAGVGASGGVDIEKEDGTGKVIKVVDIGTNVANGVSGDLIFMDGSGVKLDGNGEVVVDKYFINNL
jgi:hypothetical protein